MTETMGRAQLVGWLVRDAITNEGISYSEAARRWPISLPTLNRLMTTGTVGLRFYRTAERNLASLPEGLLELVLDGNVAAIRKMPGLAPNLREFILREISSHPPGEQRDRKR